MTKSSVRVTGKPDASLGRKPGTELYEYVHKHNLLVGPDWLSVLSFSALALFQGALTVAIAARLSRRVPSVRPGARLLLLGRIALAVVVLAALPFLAVNVGDILSA